MKLNNVNEMFYDTIHHYKIVVWRMANSRSSLNSETQKKKKKKVIWDNNSSINVYIQRKLEERIYFKLLNFKILRSFDKRETFTFSFANYNLRISPKTVKTSKFSCDDHISTTTNQLINQRVQGLAPATVHATYRNDQYRHSTTTSILISRR